MAGWAYIEERITADLKALELAGRFRSLLTLRPGSRDMPAYLDLTHNDYLALRSDEEFRRKGKNSVENVDWGSGASRLLGGNHSIFCELECRFSDFKVSSASLYFSSGYLANIGLITTLARLGGKFFSDQLNHASIIDGLKLAGIEHTNKVIFRHLDLADLEEKLQASTSPVNFILTESVFSMDGDVANLMAMQNLANQYRGVLIVDEAHAIGCFGTSGNGMISEQGLSHTQVISINACGKALGAQGALVSGPLWLRESLINHARSFIYSTAPSPYIAGIALAAIPFVASLDSRRQHLVDISQTLRRVLNTHGIDTGNSTTHIIPLILGTDKDAVAMSTRFLDNRILARAIRPPTVLEGQSRVRISLNSGLSNADLERVIDAVVTKV